MIIVLGIMKVVLGGLLLWIQWQRSIIVLVRNNPIRRIDPDGKDWIDRIAGIVMGVVTNTVPASTGLRNLYTPNNTSDYNNTLKGTDATAMVTGSIMIAVGITEIGAGGGTAAAGGAVAATGVGASVGGVVAGAGGIVAGVGAAEVVGGAVLLGNGLINSKAGYDYGKVSEIRGTGGGKNSPHANQKAKESASQKYDTAKNNLNELKSKPNKTPEDKTQIKTLEKQVKQL